MSTPTSSKNELLCKDISSTASEKDKDASTNNSPSEKARLRREALKGEAKVEHAARTADYKSMIYLRKTVSESEAYQKANPTKRQRMLEECMREGMEKRLAKGIDTVSKMAQYREAIQAGVAPEVAAAQSQVGIASFLEENGYLPPRGSEGSALPDTGVGKNLKRRRDESTQPQPQAHPDRREKPAAGGAATPQMTPPKPPGPKPVLRRADSVLPSIEPQVKFDSTERNVRSSSQLFASRPVSPKVEDEGMTTMMQEVKSAPMGPPPKGAPSKPTLQKADMTAQTLARLEVAVAKMAKDIASIKTSMVETRKSTGSVPATLSTPATTSSPLAAAVQSRERTLRQIRALEDTVQTVEKKVGLAAKNELRDVRRMIKSVINVVESGKAPARQMERSEKGQGERDKGGEGGGKGT